MSVSLISLSIRAEGYYRIAWWYYVGTRPGSTTILLVYRIEEAIIEFRGFEATIFGDIELR